MMMSEVLLDEPLRRGSNADEFFLRKPPSPLEERVAVLEVQVAFLKEKSKKDDEWKHLVQEWIYQLHEEKLKSFKDKLSELASYSQVKEPVVIEKKNGAYQMPSRIGNNGSVKRPSTYSEDKNAAKKLVRDGSITITNGKKKGSVSSNGSSTDAGSNDDIKVNGVFNGTTVEITQKKDTRDTMARTLVETDTEYRFTEGELEMDFVDEQGDVIECSPDFAEMVHITQEGDDSDQSGSQFAQTTTTLYAEVKNDDDDDYDGSLDCEVVTTQHVSESSPPEGDRTGQRYFMDGREEYTQIGKKEGDNGSFLKSGIRLSLARSSKGQKAPDFKIAGLEISELPAVGNDSCNADDTNGQFASGSKQPPSLKPMRQKASTIHYLTEKKPNFQLRKGLEDYYEYIGHRVMDDAEVNQDSRYLRNGQRSFKVQCKKCKCILSGHDSTNSNLWTHLSSAHGYSRPVPPKPTKQVKLSDANMTMSSPFSFLTQPHFLLASPDVMLSSNYDVAGSSSTSLIDLPGSECNYTSITGT